MATNEITTIPVVAETLAGIDVFANLDSRTREAIARQCFGRVYRQGQELTAPADESKDVFFVISGSVKVAVYSRSGREVVFRAMNAGSMFGELAAVDNEPRSAYIHANEDTSVAVLTQHKFLELLVTYPQISLGVMSHLSTLIRSLSTRVFEHDALKVGSRIHSELLRLADNQETEANYTEICPAPTDEEFARLVGTNRAAVNRELSNMRKANLVDKKQGCIQILDIAALRQLVENPGDRYDAGAR